ncbi:hypothetical protein PHLGIDRAFT_126563 [Phlebiopsis gigantea 11061_1 CR5-6]|uniref:Uncharacterized protein n=1 Tax=Phlebiopsis gigantea (strain 11061_1 CR5-6) TaxID=745531 RepID=A0A0C3S1R0_PHLG1|nr:hypothetical protein PHLGIDRAFT_126563 [Phlebiopsis gigantea 11061_1 CR5-6]
MDNIDHPHLIHQLVIIAGHPLETPDLRETVPLVDLLAEHLARELIDSPKPQSGANSKHKRTLYIGPDELNPTAIEIAASSKLLNRTGNFPFRSQGAFRDIACDGQYPDLDLCLVLPQKILRAQFEVLFEGIALRKVERLEVFGNPTMDPVDSQLIYEDYEPTKLHPEWSSKVFSLLENVHTLRIHSYIDPELLASYLFPSMQDPGHVRHNFPRLRLVRLNQVGVEVNEKETNRGSIYVYTFSGTFEDVLDIFERQADAGLSVGTVAISGPAWAIPFTRVQMVALRQYISMLLVKCIERTEGDIPRPTYDFSDKLYLVPEGLEDSWNVVLDPNAEIQ